ncbi:MAG TPA: tetratricopeptide repeat protein, partial [Planctomycetes bacterium]|nr:tetratricopeptide repeat protein [Planctomycetota bacterium]
WHPLTWWSHMLDVELFDLDAGAHHRTSALLHGCNALLFFLLVLRWTRVPAAAFVAAALFAWHPLRVESVAWIAERKDVLSGLFGLLALHAYTGYARRRGAARLPAYLGTLLAFGLALAAKPTLVTLPFVLLLLDLWPLRRGAPVLRLVLEKSPFFLLSFASSLITLHAQEASGATGMAGVLSAGVRVENALASIATYTAQFLRPRESACLWPHAGLLGDGAVRELLPTAVAGGLLVAAALVFAWRRRRDAPWVGVTLLWSLGSLVPMLGLVQVGYQSHADRYTYWPLLGLAVAGAMLFETLLGALPRHRGLVRFGAAAFLLTALVSARVATDAWRDSRSLWEHCIEVTGDNFLAENNLGNLFAREGKFEEALGHFERSVELYAGTAPDPDSSARWMNLAAARSALGKHQGALAALRKAVSLDPSAPQPRIALADALAREGKDGGAVRQLRRARERNPEDARVAAKLATLLATTRDDGLRDGREALELARAACKLTASRDPLAVSALAAAQAELGAFDRALALQERVLAAYRDSSSAPDPFEREMLQRMDAYRKGRAWRKTP